MSPKDDEFSVIVRCFYGMDELVEEAFNGLMYDDERVKLRNKVARILQDKPDYAMNFLTPEQTKAEYCECGESEETTVELANRTWFCRACGNYWSFFGPESEE
jgi:hypothetical protein